MARQLLYDGKHMSLDDRQRIEEGIEARKPLREIAKEIGKDPSSVKREIVARRILQQNRGTDYPVDCAKYRCCPNRNARNGSYCLNHMCPEYEKHYCKSRDRTPGACNKCSEHRSCHFPKYIYDANKADRAYHEKLKSSRVGINLTEEEAKKYGEIIAPLIKQGQSPAHVIASHPELPFTERTLYPYIEAGVFLKQHLTNCDLRNQVKRRRRKMKKEVAVQYKKRKDYSYLEGRKYTDYQTFTALHPTAKVCEMDTVYNKVTGPFIQTFKFVPLQLQIGIYHEEKTAESMLQGVNLVEKILGGDCFRKYVEVLLTDRGSEFSKADEIEHDSRHRIRTHVFFCDPMQSGEKGSCEQNHTRIRMVLPKKKELKSMGFTDQEAANLLFSHTNSLRVDSLGGESALGFAKKHAPDLYKALVKFGIAHIPSDQVHLKPDLLLRAKREKEAKAAEAQQKDATLKATT